MALDLRLLTPHGRPCCQEKAGVISLGSSLAQGISVRMGKLGMTGSEIDPTGADCKLAK